MASLTELRDQEFWRQRTAEPLTKLLRACGYDEHRCAELTRWYEKFVLPALGPRLEKHNQPQFAPCLVFDGSPCEVSQNWTECSKTRTVRFTIEATGYQAGTVADPFNQDATTALLKRVADDDNNVDVSLFVHFVKHFFIHSDQADDVLERTPLGSSRSQVWSAFDLLRDRIMPKVYFIPLLKWVQTGTATRDIVKTTIETCGQKYGSYITPYEVLEDYLDTFSPEEAPHIELTAIDCIDSPKTRVKVYLRTAVNTLAMAKEAYTLSGRVLNSVTNDALEALTQFWTILFQLDPASAEHTEVFPNEVGCGYAIEMQPGVSLPDIKIHIPVRKIDGTDKQLCDSLAKWFESRGDVNFAERYQEDLNLVFPNHDIEKGRGTHTFIAFSYTEATGVYMTMYYSTKILGTEPTGDRWRGFDAMWKARESINGPSGKS